MKNIAAILPSHGRSPFPKMPNDDATPQKEAGNLRKTKLVGKASMDGTMSPSVP
jgi:hypothetical protein